MMCQFQKHVHTYRILPDDEGFLAVQGVQPKRFKTLPELVSLYLQPNQGLVTTLLYAVDREEMAVPDDRDYSANGLSTISHEYLKGSYALDLEAVKLGASSLPHLNKTLVASCKRLNG
ncbi:Phosphatidylinositol 3,4,5-trisphosphate 5-phosphatase 2A [Goodea atripinnis]|uniref:Phosphatidylinositol 3,4,5-trisphosphate 5-phosphatase 2A n=1 Tax=Goodea atripinnis TaxID=208336 RepID=A0ABV0NE85_9TELE